MIDAPMNLTRHAEVRGRQRAIPPLAIDLLVNFGTEVPAPGGATKVFFDKPARRRLAAYAGPLSGLLNEHLNLYAVLGDQRQVITVGHRIDRVRRP